MSDILHTLLRERGEPGFPRGIYSVCSAHPWVLRASMRQAVARELPLLIEATCNQVNQEGGYTGMRPADFRDLVMGIAMEAGMPAKRLILGGDHLGPNPWRHLPAEQALAKAEAMVKEYVEAGFTKIHLDASMACAGEPARLPDEEIASRAARLGRVAETSPHAERLSYVIGTEVPTPGGATESLAGIEVTRPEEALAAIEAHREAFAAAGVPEAFASVVAVVVQPGVEFNHDSVVTYDRSKTGQLRNVLAGTSLVFEAHSTDYQRPRAYQELVEDSFCILKVGPALTFAMREALFGLAAIESELIVAESCSRLPEVLEEVMLASPKNWVSHYHGDTREQELLRRYSYSDRIRYYWHQAPLVAAVERLMKNLSNTAIPQTLLSTWLPLDYEEVRDGVLKLAPQEIAERHIQRALEPYVLACFPA